MIDAEIPLKVAQTLRELPNARMTSDLVGVTFKREKMATASRV